MAGNSAKKKIDQHVLLFFFSSIRQLHRITDHIASEHKVIPRMTWKLVTTWYE